MKTTLEFIKLTIVTVGGAIAILLLTGVASFASSNDLYKKSLGVGWGDTTTKGWNSQNGWTVTGVKEMKAYEKKTGTVLFDLQSEVTRHGDTAFFIQAPGDECFQRQSDCNRPDGSSYKRVEAKRADGFIGMSWVSFSFMIPDTYEFDSTDMSIAQFHSQYGPYPPMFMLFINEMGLVWHHESPEGMFVGEKGMHTCSPGSSTKKYCEKQMEDYQLIPFSELKTNVWYDVVFNINFDNKNIDKGFHKIWINGELVHERHNQTLWKRHKGADSRDMIANFNFGLYGSAKNNSYQAMYADEIHFGRKCSKLGINNLGYDCDQLEAQEIAESVPYVIEDRVHFHLTGGEKKYLKLPEDDVAIVQDKDVVVKSTINNNIRDELNKMFSIKN